MIIEAQFMAFVEASIFSPRSPIAAIREPMKTCISSFGEAINVASAKDKGCTVGKVDIAALDKE